MNDNTSGTDVAQQTFGADGPDLVNSIFPDEVSGRFELFSYRSAATILQGGFPDQFNQILEALKAIRISKSMIREPGGSKGPIARHVDTLFGSQWQEARLSADLTVRLTDPRQSNTIIREYVRENYLDGHRIDFVNDRVALDLEWNSKDQTYDRDLYAMSTFHLAGAIDVGVILTRGYSLNNDYFRSLGKVLDKNGNEGVGDVVSKFGASTTTMSKLIYRLNAGRNGGCPVLAIGITPDCISDD
ncbi:MAG: BglII/BstYI family type II restriction endonuclease [Pseudomonadota bacterium]